MNSGMSNCHFHSLSNQQFLLYQMLMMRKSSIKNILKNDFRQVPNQNQLTYWSWLAQIILYRKMKNSNKFFHAKEIPAFLFLICYSFDISFGKSIDCTSLYHKQNWYLHFDPHNCWLYKVFLASFTKLISSTPREPNFLSITVHADTLPKQKCWY